MLTIHLTDAKNASVIPDLQYLEEVLDVNYFSVVGAFVGLMKPGMMTLSCYSLNRFLLGVTSLQLGLVKEGILRKHVNIDPVVYVNSGT
ncbi:hypothetical protein ACLOJK_036095 [Asimina triloba]